MKILKSIAVAFSMYSRIPMPRFEWGSEDMKYHLIFFPFIGAVIGVLEYGWLLLSGYLSISHLVFALIAVIIPVVVTGGFHVDGFMDTSDALAFWGDKEKRLAILKDSHVGAFAIIRFLTLGVIVFSSVFTMKEKGFFAWCFSFFIARAVSGICVVRNKKAKSEGSLFTLSQTADEKIVMCGLALEVLACAILAEYYFEWYWICGLAALLLALINYLYTATTKFGGITGDLAGWFVCRAETFMAVAIAIFSLFQR